MTRDEMLQEIEALRADGHTVAVTGHATDWTCTLDGKLYKAKGPMEAFELAKASLS